MPHLHVVKYHGEHGIVREHVSRGFGWRIVTQIRPCARLALLRGFYHCVNAVAHIVVKDVCGKTRIGHGNGVKRLSLVGVWSVNIAWRELSILVCQMLILGTRPST